MNLSFSIPDYLSIVRDYLSFRDYQNKKFDKLILINENASSPLRQFAHSKLLSREREI